MSLMEELKKAVQASNRNWTTPYVDMKGVVTTSLKLAGGRTAYVCGHPNGRWESGIITPNSSPNSPEIKYDTWESAEQAIECISRRR